MLYRVLAASDLFADFGAGFRAWGFSANISLNNPGLLAGGSVKRSAGWDGPLLATHYHYDFGLGSNRTKNVVFPVVLIYTGAVFWIFCGKLGKVPRARWLKSTIAFQLKKRC